MTKKDYELIAKAIVEARAIIAQGRPMSADDVLAEVVTQLRRALKSDNAAFKDDRFWSACFR